MEQLQHSGVVGFLHAVTMMFVQNDYNIKGANDADWSLYWFPHTGARTIMKPNEGFHYYYPSRGQWTNNTIGDKNAPSFVFNFETPYQGKITNIRFKMYNMYIHYNTYKQALKYVLWDDGQKEGIINIRSRKQSAVTYLYNQPDPEVACDFKFSRVTCDVPNSVSPLSKFSRQNENGCYQQGEKPFHCNIKDNTSIEFVHHCMHYNLDSREDYMKVEGNICNQFDFTMKENYFKLSSSLGTATVDYPMAENIWYMYSDTIPWNEMLQWKISSKDLLIMTYNSVINNYRTVVYDLYGKKWLNSINVSPKKVEVHDATYANLTYSIENDKSKLIMVDKVVSIELEGLESLTMVGSQGELGARAGNLPNFAQVVCTDLKANSRALSVFHGGWRVVHNELSIEFKNEEQQIHFFYENEKIEIVDLEKRKLLLEYKTDFIDDYLIMTNYSLNQNNEGKTSNIFHVCRKGKDFSIHLKKDIIIIDRVDFHLYIDLALKEVTNELGTAGWSQDGKLYARCAELYASIEVDDQEAITSIDAKGGNNFIKFNQDGLINVRSTHNNYHFDFEKVDDQMVLIVNQTQIIID